MNAKKKKAARFEKKWNAALDAAEKGLRDALTKDPDEPWPFCHPSFQAHLDIHVELSDVE